MEQIRGPWEVRPTDPAQGWDGFEIIDCDGLRVADVHGYQREAIRRNNAHLIGAAPDLFAALTEVLRRLDNGPDNPDAFESIGAQLPAGGELCEEKVDDLIRFVRAALAKARGAHPERADASSSEEAGS
jgi:hypothetical protein